VVVGNLMAFALCLPMALPVEKATAADLWVLFYLGAFQVALAYVLLTKSMRHVPGLEAATLLLVEPVFNPVWTWLLRGERPGGLALLGGGVIILSAFLRTLWESRRVADQNVWGG
jgi:drug/metabolite transporter (DMT)-like permease